MTINEMITEMQTRYPYMNFNHLKRAGREAVAEQYKRFLEIKKESG